MVIKYFFSLVIMKYLPALLLPVQVSCSLPKVIEKPGPMIIEIESTKQTVEEETIFSEEISYKKVVGFVRDSFAQMQRQQHKPTLEGRIYASNSNQLFEYHYEPLLFCEPDSEKRYAGKITFQYYSSEEIGNKKMSTLTTLTDVAPFGSVDKVELFVDGTVQTPFYANYPAGWKARQLHEHLFRHIYQVLERHAQHHTTWEDFDRGAITKDDKWQTYKLHHELLQSLLSQEPLRWEELKIYNPCEL